MALLNRSAFGSAKIAEHYHHGGWGDLSLTGQLATAVAAQLLVGGPVLPYAAPPPKFHSAFGQTWPVAFGQSGGIADLGY